MVKKSKQQKASVNMVKKKILQESNDLRYQTWTRTSSTRMMKMTTQIAQETCVLYDENSDEKTKCGIGTHTVGFRLMPTVIAGLGLCLQLCVRYVWILIVLCWSPLLTNADSGDRFFLMQCSTIDKPNWLK